MVALALFKHAWFPTYLMTVINSINYAQSKFKTEEIGLIMIELLSSIRSCENKEQQLELATK